MCLRTMWRTEFSAVRAKLRQHASEGIVVIGKYKLSDLKLRVWPDEKLSDQHELVRIALLGGSLPSGFFGDSCGGLLARSQCAQTKISAMRQPSVRGRAVTVKRQSIMAGHLIT